MSAAIQPQTLTPRDRAIQSQSQASDHKVSAFVEASAGSGKTKLLTDRILRLMLGGAPPARIQCLTFTKAAAAEMALRLQHQLGEWVTLDDEALDARLRPLEVTPTDKIRTDARALFAEVLDLPGGMRIGTIHAFCQSLLRRFPLEAAISPHFQLVEGDEVEAELRAAREGMLEQANPTDVAEVAGLLRAVDFAKLIHDLQAARSRLAPLLALPPAAQAAAIHRAACTEAPTEAAVLARNMAWPGEPTLRQALQKLQSGGKEGVTRSRTMLAWLSFPPDQRIAHWPDWVNEFFTKDADARKFGTFIGKKLDELHPEIREALETEQVRVWHIQDACRAVRTADATIALLRLATPALDSYATQKQRAGLLDYSDLVARTESLLNHPGAAWVLYKLDGGIDHLLLDEVQDTAPEQWRIAHRLTEEFFQGDAARDLEFPRTFFAVGDPKQSIYSFQGADPEEFTKSRETMQRRVAGGGETWRNVTLDVSFRSNTPILALVDAVFTDPIAAQGVADTGPITHIPNRAGAGGAVALWPLAPAPPTTKSPDWTVPSENQGLVSAPQRLADAIAQAIRAELDACTPLQSRARPLEPGDILILVRRRGTFANALVRALKAQDIPVAGLDRLELTQQIAVQDVLATCDAVLLPSDDLAVARVLTSPLGGLTDDSLMHLAMHRPGTLWDALRDRAPERPEWQAAWHFLATIAERADYVSPHALLAEALGPLEGRARLLARLGAEAAEPIDELLNAALDYARLHPPSLQGFIHWLRRSGAEVKREAGGSGSVIRVMTVHGAKGLQAPLVILPDTTGLPPEKDSLLWSTVDQGTAQGAAQGIGAMEVPLWSPRKELRCAAIERARAKTADLRRREYNRLLYVALTRAEDRLIVCGWETRKGKVEETWYAMVQRAFATLDPETHLCPGGLDGDMLLLAAPQTDPPTPGRPDTDAAAPPLPPWAGQPGKWRPAPLPPEPALPIPIAPSRPIGAMFGPIPPALSPLLVTPGPRYARGLAAHALLQHLPEEPEPNRQTAARAFLARTTLDPAAQAQVATEVLAVLAHPALTPLFAPGSRAEQPLSGLIEGQVVSGIVDRLVILPDRVILADFKTGRPAPIDVENTPIRYLRQLAAYRAVLQTLFPTHTMECALIWTEGAVIANIPNTLLDRHAPQSTSPTP